MHTFNKFTYKLDKQSYNRKKINTFLKKYYNELRDKN